MTENLIEMVLQKEYDDSVNNENNGCVRWSIDTLEYAFDELKELSRLAEIGRKVIENRLKFESYIDTLEVIPVVKHNLDTDEMKNQTQSFINSLSEEQKSDIAKQISVFASEFREGSNGNN